MATLTDSLYPLINLDNSAHHVSTVCGADTCDFTFANTKALDTAVANWKADDVASSAGVVLISANVEFTTGRAEEARAFLLVDSITKVAGDSFTGSFTQVRVEEILGDDHDVVVQLGYGAVREVQSDGTVSASSTAHDFSSYEEEALTRRIRSRRLRHLKSRRSLGHVSPAGCMQRFRG